MKKLILLLIVLFIVFVAIERQRLYLRDPLATVTRDGVKEDGAQVYINFSNDVLIENDHAPMYVTVIQHDNHVGTPVALKGMHYIAYLADADVVTLIATDKTAVVETMTGKAVTYHDAHRQTVITLH
jgi:hypothetical protein